MSNPTPMFATATKWLIYGGLILAYLFGLTIDVMDVDAAQYASIAREMLENGKYLQVQHWHQDYLDKPPLLFWLACLSYKILGPTTVAYKLPSLLFSIAGIFSTYKLTRLYYPRSAARISALVLTSCQAMLLINNDVRTDTMLTAAVIFATWQMAAYLQSGSYKNLFGGSVGIGLAMLAKGPIGIVVPALALGGHLLVKKDFRSIFKPQWLLTLMIVGIILLPMCIGLYQQYGWHGVNFYFWLQSFGRITGENRWRNDAGFLFFPGTFVWAFLPWTFLFLVAFWKKIKGLVQQKFKITENEELISLFGFVLPFLALSFSHYKLPHYIFVTFPFAAVLLGDWIDKVISQKDNLTGLIILQAFVNLSLWIGAGLLLFYVFPVSKYWLLFLLIPFLLLFFYHLYKGHTKARLVSASLLSIIGFNLVLNIHFYPNLLQFQPAKAISKKLDTENVPVDQFYYYKQNSHATDFYTGDVAQGIYHENHIKSRLGNTFWLYAKEQFLKEIKETGANFTIQETYDVYPAVRLTPGFLNPKTRNNYLKKAYLLKIEPKL